MKEPSSGTGEATYLRTAGEDLFGHYLGERGRSFAYEQQVGSARPDFLLEGSDGRVVCEVIDPKPQVDLLDEEHPWRVGSVHPYAHIRQSIDRKRRQNRGARGQMPYVLVIHPTADVRPYGVDSLMGAMLGDLAFSIPVARGPTSEPRPPASITFSSGGRIQPQMNTTFSAVAVLRTINPTAHALDREIKLHSGRPGSGKRWPSTGRVMKHVRRYERIKIKLTHAGIYDPNLALPRVDVVHSPYALEPLAWTFFDGPFDRQWAVAPGDDRMQLVLVGIGGRVLDGSEGFA